jgi:DNA-binding GntR family transcriptional regulator
MPLVLRTFRRYNHGELRRSNNQHEELVAALKAGDGVWARSVMTGHILSEQHTLLSTLALNGDGSAEVEFDESQHESAKEASR